MKTERYYKVMTQMTHLGPDWMETGLRYSTRRQAAKAVRERRKVLLGWGQKAVLVTVTEEEIEA